MVIYTPLLKQKIPRHKTVKYINRQCLLSARPIPVPHHRVKLIAKTLRISLLIHCRTEFCDWSVLREMRNVYNVADLYSLGVVPLVAVCCLIIVSIIETAEAMNRSFAEAWL